ncbi:MAG: AAA family ATPase [Pseudohongiellaceae bacterium]
MDYAFIRAEGFVMITGQPGIGKTTLIAALVEELANTPVSIANLVCTQLQADDLLKMVAYDFGIASTVVGKGELLQSLTQQLKTWHRDGRRALLIVDEAQDLSISAMEELRLLTNIQVDSRPLLQIFLLGQPELRELVLSPRLEQVHQRIIAAAHIMPLKSDETEAYIRHRLKAVHWRGNPAISKAVYPLVFKFSEGVPRRINLICSRLLLHCAVEQRNRIAVADVREVVRELQSENLASGDSFAESDFQVEDVFDEVIRKGSGKDDKAAAAHQGGGRRGQGKTAVAQRRVARDTRRAVPAPAVPSEPEENKPVKLSRGRTPSKAPNTSRARPAATTDREAGEKTVARPAVKADTKRNRKVTPGPQSLSSSDGFFWSILLLLLVTGTVLAYRIWI